MKNISVINIILLLSAFPTQAADETKSTWSEIFNSGQQLVYETDLIITTYDTYHCGSGPDALAVIRNKTKGTDRGRSRFARYEIREEWLVFYSNSDGATLREIKLLEKNGNELKVFIKEVGESLMTVRVEEKSQIQQKDRPSANEADEK